MMGTEERLNQPVGGGGGGGRGGGGLNSEGVCNEMRSDDQMLCELVQTSEGGVCNEMRIDDQMCELVQTKSGILKDDKCLQKEIVRAQIISAESVSVQSELFTNGGLEVQDGCPELRDVDEGSTPGVPETERYIQGADPDKTGSLFHLQSSGSTEGKNDSPESIRVETEPTENSRKKGDFTSNIEDPGSNEGYGKPSTDEDRELMKESEAEDESTRDCSVRMRLKGLGKDCWNSSSESFSVRQRLRRSVSLAEVNILEQSPILRQGIRRPTSFSKGKAFEQPPLVRQSIRQSVSLSDVNAVPEPPTKSKNLWKNFSLGQNRLFSSLAELFNGLFSSQPKQRRRSVSSLPTEKKVPIKHRFFSWRGKKSAIENENRVKNDILTNLVVVPGSLVIQELKEKIEELKKSEVKGERSLNEEEKEESQAINERIYDDIVNIHGRGWVQRQVSEIEIRLAMAKKRRESEEDIAKRRRSESCGSKGNENSNFVLSDFKRHNFAESPFLKKFVPRITCEKKSNCVQSFEQMHDESSDEVFIGNSENSENEGRHLPEQYSLFAQNAVSDNESLSSDDTTIEDDDDDNDDDEEEEEGRDTVEIRTKRYSIPVRSSTSSYRYSSIRPRTVIFGVGVCTETQFFSESFGDGVSETESEDDEEDVGPAITSHAHHSTHTTSSSRPHSRPHSPSRTQLSRSHSPLSDMDTESKRNSQAVSTEPSEVDDHSSVTTSDLESCHDPSSPRSSLLAPDTTTTTHDLDHTQPARKDKYYRIAHELLFTERTYVKVLHLIDQEFQFRVDNENRAHHMFAQDNIPQMFSNVKSIYKLHHDFLLPQLEERMAQWDHKRRIGDIMKNFAPFLKMYTEYVRNFDNAMNLINHWQAKCHRFAAIMDDIHNMEVCGNLTLQHHMLSPVQRIPRYEMLLRDYLKKLPEDSPDRHDTEKALHLVSTAANHANDAMKKIDKFEKLLEIQESLGGAVDLVSPTRELVKEGKIIKISARSGDHQERYMFLLTDLLLLCSPRLMGGRVMSGPQYRLRAKYNVENLQVLEGDNLETANTFYIRDKNKSVELYTQTVKEKEQWLEAFFRAIHETCQRKSSLKLHFSPDQRIIDVDLGQKQPILIRSDSVPKCMECGSQFTMVRRKHHCRACGVVVCNKCSSFKACLAYDSGKSVRVCRKCHTTLQELSSSTATPSPDVDDADECSLYNVKEPPDIAFRSRGVLEVSAKTCGAVMQGFLQLKTHRKAWVKRWFALHTDFVLYSFKCEADDQALTATPVPGFTVTHLQGTRNESGISDKEKERAFKLYHSKKHYIFQAASKEESQRWVAALKKASQAELPSPIQ